MEKARPLCFFGTFLQDLGPSIYRYEPIDIVYGVFTLNFVFYYRFWGAKLMLCGVRFFYCFECVDFDLICIFNDRGPGLD